MGMAASQARYLALVARQSNCEYEGQQINQSRLNLANQTANLFNQMLGLSVPVPPSVQDFTKTQYSFTDGYNEAVIDKWEQLAAPDDDGYNYVVEYHYEANVYRGFEKKMNDPQIQFTYVTPTDTDITAERAAVRDIYSSQQSISDAQKAYDEAKETYEAWKSKCEKLVTYRDSETMANKAQITDHTTNAYTVFPNADRSGDPKIYYSYDILGKNATVGTASLWTDPNTGNVYKDYADGRTAVTPGTTLYAVNCTTEGDATTGTLSTKPDSNPGTYTVELNTQALKNLYIAGSDGAYTLTNNSDDGTLVYGTPEDKSKMDDYIKMWEANGVSVDPSDLYFDPTGDGGNGTIAFKSDLDSLSAVDTGLMKTLYLYHYDDNTSRTTDDTYQSIKSANDTLASLKTNAENAYADLKVAETGFETLNVPTYVGNSKLTSLGELTTEQFAEIKQVITDMTANGADCNFVKCFSSSLSIDKDNYIGGIYSFVRDGVTYYTTYYDLADTAAASTFTNAIDNQPKLDYFYATYVKDNIESVDKAILDTDSKGRFKSIRFANDGSTYTLNFEQITDDEAYQDAMNQYNYENAQYDKMIKDINAKTSLIQQEDQQLELRLKQLDTERNALSNEIEAVSKVVKDNVEKSFKTFGG